GSQSLGLEDIHVHWWIQGRSPISQLEEHNPNIVYTKERPIDATNNQSSNSTRRDPSGFESVEQN
ncbi:7291_t:CDS:2, partial [Paraglomus occultum]